jgi:GNAT superfamily N-acetyltransferase
VAKIGRDKSSVYDRVQYSFYVKLSLMEKITFEKIVYQNWTNYFGCSVETALQNGTTLLPESKYDGDKIIALWHIGKHTFVQLDPAYFSALDKLVKNLPTNISLTGEHIQEIWGGEAILSRDVGLTYYLFPPDLPDYLPAYPFILRPLTEADAGVMSALHAANTLEDVDEGYVEVTHLVAFGCFLNQSLVAAASGYERTGFLDIGVLTHPEFRKRGLGKSVVGGLCDWGNQHNIIAQYRHNITNTGSQKVAGSLNFQMYFKSEDISFR